MVSSLCIQLEMMLYENRRFSIDTAEKITSPHVDEFTQAHLRLLYIYLNYMDPKKSDPPSFLPISQKISWQQLMLPIIAAAILALLSWPVWRWLWQEWMGNEYYSHGVLIPAVALFLVVQRMRNDKSFSWQWDVNNISCLLLFALGLIAFLYFVNFKTYYLASFVLIALIGTLIWAFGGKIAASKLVFPIAYLAFMIPLPFIERSTLPLALFTGVCSSGLVQLLGVNLNVVGNAITLPNANLVIGAQCSGINSLIALTALTALAAYILEGPLWAKILLTLLAIPLALISNILRVSSLIFVARWYGADSAFTFYHDYSGPIFFIVVLLLLYPLTKILRFRNLRLDVI